MHILIDFIDLSMFYLRGNILFYFILIFKGFAYEYL